MDNKITLQNNLTMLLDSPSAKEGKPEKDKISFSSVLKGSLDEINRLQGEANKSIEDLSIGKSGNIHETMIALEKADVSFRLMLEVRNKIIETYQEVMRMPV